MFNKNKESTITGLTQKIECSRKAYIMLLNSIHIFIENHYFQAVPEETLLVLMGIILK